MLILVIGLSQVSVGYFFWSRFSRCIYYFLNRVGIVKLQYLKHVRPFRDLPIFERFPVLICVTIVWIYSVILTASGAYRNKPMKTQLSCRTDRANLITTAPWWAETFTSLDVAFIELLVVKKFRNMFAVLGSSFHTLCSGVLLHFQLVIHLLWWLLFLFQWLRYFFFSHSENELMSKTCCS